MSYAFPAAGQVVGVPIGTRLFSEVVTRPRTGAAQSPAAHA